MITWKMLKSETKPCKSMSNRGQSRDIQVNLCEDLGKYFVQVFACSGGFEWGGCLTPRLSKLEAEKYFEKYLEDPDESYAKASMYHTKYNNDLLSW